jgi:hypothetical protein
VNNCNRGTSLVLEMFAYRGPRPGAATCSADTRPCLWRQDDKDSHGDDWMVLSMKLMSGTARLAPLSATTPVGCLPAPVAQIRLSWTWRFVEQMGRRARVGSVLLGPSDPVVVAGQPVAVDLDVEARSHGDAAVPVPGFGAEAVAVDQLLRMTASWLIS